MSSSTQGPQNPAKTPTRRARKSTRASFGSVRKLPSGRYQARYTDIRMNRHTAPITFATKKQGEDWLATTRADIVRGTWRAPELSTITLANYARDYLASRLDLAPRTRETYAEVVEAWLCQPLAFPPTPGRRPRTVNLGTTELGSLTVALIRDWHTAALHTTHERAIIRAEASRASQHRAAQHSARAWALANGHDVHNTGRLPRAVLDAWKAAGSPAARAATQLEAPVHVPSDAGRARVAQAYRVLRLILNNAVTDGRIDANPCHIPGAGQIKATERKPATPAEIVALADAMPTRYAAAVHVASWSGLRAGELFGLARRHVDLDAGTLRVERAAIYLANSIHLGPTKTESSRRLVHLPPHVVTILRQHMETYTGTSPDALIFTSTAGTIVSKGVRKKTFWRARATVGRPDLRWHDLRHTGATMAAQAGASLRELQHRLGHSTVNAAMIYQHASSERDRELAQRLSLLAADTSATVIPLHGRTATA